MDWPFKCQPHKMVKYTQAFFVGKSRQIVWVCLTIFCRVIAQRGNRFRILASRATLALDEAWFVVMATFALYNLLRLKSRDSYTRKCSDDKIQSNKSLLQGETCENPSTNNNWSGESSYRQTKLKCRKIRTLLLEYLTGRRQIPWHLKAVKE